MNVLSFFLEHRNVATVAFLATVVMVAISFWSIRHRFDRWYLVVVWMAFLLMLGVGCWRTERVANVARDEWQNNFLRTTKAFASATEIMEHWKIDGNTQPDDPKDPTSQIYWRIWNVHAAWCRDVPQVAYVFTLRLKPNESDKVVFIVSCESDINEDGNIDGEAEVGEGLYKEYDEWFDVYGKGFAGELTLDENIESNQYGRFVTAVSPLRDPEGNIEAILGVDFRIDKWEALTRQMQFVSIVLFVVVLSLYLAGVFFVAVLRESYHKLSETNRDLVEAKKFADLAARAKSDFLANMSHEIRTPMNAVFGFTDILIQRLIWHSTPQEREESEGIVEIIRKNSRDLLTIINDILDFSRMEANLLEVESVPVSIKHVIEDIRQMAQPNAEAKFLELSVEYREPIPDQILSDPTRLRQILMNLVSNAIKFTEKGRVRIRCSTVIGPRSADDDRSDGKSIPAPMILRVDVIDTGIGISAVQLKGLFTPFMQVDTSTTRRFGGTGLGLSIAKKLAVMLDGDITVASKPGLGSTFSLLVHVYLPTDKSLRQVRMESTKQESGFSTFDSGVRLLDRGPSIRTDSKIEAAPSLTPPLEGIRVLLVEDMVVNQLVVSTQLKDAGAKVEVAGNGEIGLKKINSDADNGLLFDIVLMDMQMPVMDGYEATRALREQGYKRPIIAITAHALSGDREKTIEAGCDDYITKPVDRKVLIQTVKKHLK